MAVESETENPATDRGQRVNDRLNANQGEVNPTTAVTNEAEEFKIEFNDNIRLYFLRYGLFANHVKDEHLVSPDSKEDEHQELNLPTYGDLEAPSLEHFYVGLTALNSGYLYMFDANEENLFYEYKLHADGRAQTTYEPIYVDDNRTNDGNIEDFRTSSGEYEVKKEFVKDQVLWIGYSQVQWTGEYYQKMILVDDSKKKSFGMIKVECKGFPDGLDQEHVLQQSEVRATFREDQKASDQWFDNVLGQIYKHENNLKPDDIKKDMFIVLSDPIGCALDMTMAISTELISHRAFVESLRSGRDPEGIVLELTTNTNPQPYNDIEKEQVAMVTLAQTVYQHIYSDPNSDLWKEFAGGRSFMFNNVIFDEHGGQRLDPERRERYFPDYNAGVKLEKLEAVLAKEERKKQRELINNLQTDLATYVFDPYYMDAYHHDIESDAINILGSKKIATQIFRGLAINPHNIDRSFDLPEVKSFPMPWLEKLEKTLKLEDEYTVYKLLSLKIEEDNSVVKNKEDLANKVFDFIQGSLEVYEFYLLKTQSIELYEVFVKRINTTKTVSGFGFSVTQHVSQEIRNISGDLMSTNHTSKIIRSVGNLNTGASISWLNPNGVDEIDEVIGESRYMQNFINKSNSLGIVLTPTDVSTSSITGNQIFKSLSVVVHLFNFKAALVSYYNDNSWRNSVALAGAIVEATEAGLLLSSKLSIRAGSQISTSSILMSSLFRVGTGLTAVVSIMDSTNSFAEGDNAAGIAHGIATACFVLSLIPGGIVFSALLLGVGFLFTLLGFAWKRSDLERFFEDFAFCTMGLDFPPRSARLPHAYNRMIATNRSQYTKYGETMNSELHFFQDDLAWYMNNIISVNFSTQRIVNRSDLLFSRYHNGLVNKFNVILSTSFNITDSSQLEYMIFHNIATKDFNVKLDDRGNTVQIIPNLGSPFISNQIVVNFSIPEFSDHLYFDPDALFICRLKINENDFFPFDYVNKKLFLGFKISTLVPADSFGTFSYLTEEPKIDTIENFINGSVW